MNADRIMDALGNVNEDFIMESAPSPKKAGKPKIRWIAATIAVVMMLTFFQTAPGAAALELVKETITNIIETMFPPKDIEITLEGESEVVPHEAGGQGPSFQDDGTTPGFAIYYDPERYVMTTENDATYIRQIIVLPTREEVRQNNAALFEGLTGQEVEAKIDELLAQQEDLYANLPICEMEIIHLPDISPANAAQAAQLEAESNWESVTEVTNSELPAGYCFSASIGQNWDSPREQVCFTSDGQDGTFKISVRYFLEAAEGHGTRFMNMLQTFELITP